MDKKTVVYKEIASPVGTIVIGKMKDWLRFLKFSDRLSFELLVEKRGFKSVYSPHNPFLLDVEKQINEYFEKKRKVFDIPLILEGTEFQKKCWNALLTIPYGKTISYMEQAEMVGNPKAVRACANANRLNPIAIIIPCHRVIGKDGSLTGYAAGISKKRFLLELEGVKF